MLKKVVLSSGGVPHLAGCGVYEMLAIRSTDLSKERKIRLTNCSWPFFFIGGSPSGFVRQDSL